MARQRANWKGKTALVTGASSGIGAATARLLAAQGLRVILTARREDRLISLQGEIMRAGGHADVLPGDLSDPLDRQRILEELMSNHPVIDVLINNAGLGWYGYLKDMSSELASRMLQVNVAALVELTMHLLPGMVTRGQGRIINISSISAAIPSQGIAIYGATKSFIDSFTTALHRELTGSSVAVTTIRPGPVKSEFYELAALQTGGNRIPAERFSITSERVAAAVWRAVRSPRRVMNVPWYLGIVPWVEILFGWIIDLVGPVLLRRTAQTSKL